MPNVDVVTILSKWLRFADQGVYGDNIAAYCPFHKNGMEATPSLYVKVGSKGTNQGAAFCHTCSRGWSFTGLLYKLGADRALIDELRGTAARLPTEAEKQAAVDEWLRNMDLEQTELPETVLSVYDYCPLDLVRAGFSKDTLQYFEVGFDRDSQRITFPLRDHDGRFIGVSGRTVVGDPERYKVYRSEFYCLAGSSYKVEKSKVLWGLDKFYHARLNMPSSQPVVVCEGYKAAMWVYQAGYTDVVALQGTSLSAEQRFLLGHATSDVVLFLDNDKAGRTGTWSRSRELTSLDVRVANYGDKERLPVSPDDLSPNEVVKAIETAVSGHNWRLANARKNTYTSW
jgi:hypothetical protein